MVSQFGDNNTLDVKNKRIFSFSSKMVLFFLFLAALNFMNRFAYCVFIAFAIFLILDIKNIKVGKEIIVLILFSLSLLIFWRSGSSSITAMLRNFTFPICFLMGYNLPIQTTSVEDRERSFNIITVILSLGTWLHLMLNFSINVSNEEVSRNTVDFWIGDNLAATGQAALACLIIPVAVSCLFSNNKIWLKICAGISLFFVLYYNLILAGRSILVLLIVSAAVALIYYLKNSKNLTKKIFVIFCIAVIVVGLVIAYNSNVFGIKDIVTDSNLYERFFDESASEITSDSRTKNKLKYIKYLGQYPFGGGYIHEIVGFHSHDLYLDTYDEAGIFAFMFIVIVVLDFAFKTVTVLKSNQVSFKTKQMLLCIFVVLNVEFWIEPILAGMTWLLACFCIIYGSVCRLQKV